MSLNRSLGPGAVLPPGGGPEPLINIAAMVTAKHASCVDMEKQSMNDDMLKMVSFLAFPKDLNVIKAIANMTSRDDYTWKRGINHVNKKDVREIRQVGFMVIAVVAEYKVSVIFEKQQIMSTSCSCSDKIWCSHIIAAIIYRIENPDKVPVHAPLTETLSSMNRDQLQIVLQNAVDADAVGVLSKVFVKIDEIRNTRSEINTIPGLPDPTFGIGPDTNTTLKLTVQELSRSFSKECKNVGYYFSDIIDEAKLRKSPCYKFYIQQVVDLVRLNQVNAAGQVLIALVTEAANVALSKSWKIEKNYLNVMKTLERMCSYYILEFTGQARGDLIVLCQNLNKTLKIDSGHSSWVDFPPISQLYHFYRVNDPDITNESQTFMFYEPLCVSVVPDPGTEFYELLSNKTSTLSCILYNEPLPLMFIRFESFRLWNNADETQRILIAFGIIILRKLLQATQEFSILYQQDSTQEENEIVCIRKRRNANNNMVTGHSSDDFTSDTNMAKYVLVEISNILADEPKPSMLQKYTEEGYTDTRLSQLLNSAEKPKLQPDWDHISEEMLSFCITYICNVLYRVNCFHKYLSQTDKDILVLATLRALELSRYHTDVRLRHTISDEERESLQSLEHNLFECYRDHIEGNKLVEAKVLTGLEAMYMKKLCLCNTRHVCFFNSVVPLSLISFLVRRQLTDQKLSHMEKGIGRNLALHTLCHSNKPLVYYVLQKVTVFNNKDCYMNYFQEIVKCLLNHIKNLQEGNFYLTKLLDHYRRVHDGKAINCILDELQNVTRTFITEEMLNSLLNVLSNCIENNKICHLSYFKGIVKLLMKHVRSFPDGKLLNQNSRLRDGEAMLIILDELQNHSWTSMSKKTLVAYLKFILTCIEYNNTVDDIFSRSRAPLVCKIMEFLCIKLGLTFVMNVLDCWNQIVKFYSDYQLKSLVARMNNALPRGSPVSNRLLSLIKKYFSETFKHTVRSCITLELIDDDDSLEKMFETIQENRKNFTAIALANIAKRKTKLEEKKRKRRFNRFLNMACCGSAFLIVCLSWLMFYR